MRSGRIAMVVLRSSDEPPSLPAPAPSAFPAPVGEDSITSSTVLSCASAIVPIPRLLAHSILFGSLGTGNIAVALGARDVLREPMVVPLPPLRRRSRSCDRAVARTLSRDCAVSSIALTPPAPHSSGSTGSSSGGSPGSAPCLVARGAAPSSCRCRHLRTLSSRIGEERGLVVRIGAGSRRERTGLGCHVPLHGFGGTRVL